MEYEIRSAEERDINGILKLLEDIKQLHYKGRPDIFTDGGTKFDYAQILNMLTSNHEHIFVAASENELLGYLFTEIKHSKNHPVMKDSICLYVHDLCISESARGKGIGKKLMDYAKTFAKESGCQRIELNVWEFNQGAVKFYENYGMGTQRRQMEMPLEDFDVR